MSQAPRTVSLLVPSPSPMTSFQEVTHPRFLSKPVLHPSGRIDLPVPCALLCPV